MNQNMHNLTYMRYMRSRNQPLSSIRETGRMRKIKIDVLSSAPVKSENTPKLLGQSDYISWSNACEVLQQVANPIMYCDGYTNDIQSS